MHLTFHRSIFWAHLIAGILAGIVILSMAVTGLMISYETQIMDWANRGMRVTPPAPDAPRLDVETLVAKVKETKPGLNPSGITWKADPTMPVTLSVGREGTFYANPYTGAFLGGQNHAVHDFFHAATDWHRFLTGTGLPKEVGKAITGAGCLVFGILLVSGIYLWWPKHWRWVNVKAVILFNRRLKGRARDWNWHNVFGFWTSFPMLLIILTGLIMSYSWANQLLFAATGNVPPPPRAAGGPGGGGGGRPAGPPPSLAGLEPLLAQARQQVPDWASLSLRMPQKPGEPFPIMVDRGGRGEVHRRTMLNLDVAQGKVSTSPDDFTQVNKGRQLRFVARFLHTGELFGVVGQTVAALCAVAAIMLVWTGFALAWRRFFGKKAAVASSS
ncbi:MAG TPA: PepSY-associated TM helix domain-containing protein [Prosthecobacter sp.]